MSLVAWYPLNGNTNDYSGNNILTTNSNITYGNGKIGQSAIYNGASSYNYINNPIIQGSDFSFSTWIYTNSVVNQGIFSCRTAVGEGISLFILGGGGTNYIRFDTDASTQWTTSYIVPTTTWIHITVTKNSTSKKLYVNGVLHSSTNSVGTMATLSSVFSLGASHINGTGWGNYLNGSLNDVRIYNHALSEKEIKEIAKAKILHYTFDDFQEPTTNLVGNPNFISGNHITQFSAAASYGIYSIETLSNPGVSPYVLRQRTGEYEMIFSEGLFATGTTYTMSCWVAYTSDWDGNNIIFHSRFFGTPDNTSITGTPVGTLETRVIDGLTWARVYASITTPATTVTSLSWYLGYSDTNATVGYRYFTQLQLEKKSYPTEFVDGSRTGRVNDQSGFRNNATLTEATTPQWVSDSKIGSGAYRFSTKHIPINTSPTFKSTDNWSFSLYLKIPSGLDSNWRNFITNVDGQDTNSTWLFHGGTQLIFYQDYYSTTYIWYSGLNLGTQLPLDTWFHLVITNTPTSTYLSTITAYINGQQMASSSFTWSPRLAEPLMQFGRLGCSGGRAFIGSIDDFKIYATTLSSTDILELYQTRASVDNAGNLFLTEIKQSDNLAPNPSFEEDSIGAISAPVGWVREVGEGFNIVSSDSPNTRSTKALHYPKGSYRRIRSNWFKVTPGETIYGQCYAKGETGSSFYFGLYWKTKTNSTYSYFAYDVGTSWELKSGSLVVPAGAIEAGIWLFNYGTPTGDLWTDDVYVTRRNGINVLNEIQLDSLGEKVIFTEKSLAKTYNVSELGITDGLVAYYPFDKDARDYSGNGNHGTVSGAVLSSGIKGGAYSFDGVNDSIAVVTTNFNRVNNEELTVSAWIKPSRLGGQYQEIIANRSSSPEYNWMIFQHTTDGSIQLHGANQNKSTYIPTINNWIQVTATVDINQNYKLYINGSLVQTVTGFTFGAASSQLSIGYFPNTEYFLGAIDEVRIYNRALSIEEISILYETTAPSTAAMKITKDTVYLKGEFKEVI